MTGSVQAAPVTVTTTRPGLLRSPLFWLGVVLVLALVPRLVNLIDSSDSPFFDHPVVDGRAYDEWAQRIAAGKEEAEPFYQDPLYPYLLAGVYRVVGRHFWFVYALQLLLGLAVIALVFDLTRRLFDLRAAVVAGLLAALYKPFIFYEGQVEKTALAVFLVAAGLWFHVRAWQQSRPALALAAGLAIGLGSLVRSNLLLFVLLLPLTYIVGRQRRWRAAVLALLGGLLVVVPVSVRNSVIAREPLLTTTQVGQNLYIGNSEHNRTGQYAQPPWVRPTPQYEQADFASYAQREERRALTPGQVSAFYVRKTLEWTFKEPGRWASLLGRKVAVYLSDFEVPDNQDVGFMSRYSGVLRWPLPGFGILLALGVAGMLLLVRRSAARWHLVVSFVLFGLSTVAFFVFSRYRLPAVPALLPFAGGFVAWLVDGLRSPRERRAIAARVLGLALVGGCFGLTMLPVPRTSAEVVAVKSLTNVAARMMADGDTAGAGRVLANVLLTMPSYPPAMTGLALVRMQSADTAAAESLLRRSIELDSTSALSHFYLGRIAEARGDYEGADYRYGLAYLVPPPRTAYRLAQARVVALSGRVEQSLREYESMLELFPNDRVIRQERALTLYRIGRRDEAVTELSRLRAEGVDLSAQAESLLQLSR